MLCVCIQLQSVQEQLGKISSDKTLKKDKKKHRDMTTTGVTAPTAAMAYTHLAAPARSELSRQQPRLPSTSPQSTRQSSYVTPARPGSSQLTTPTYSTLSNTPHSYVAPGPTQPQPYMSTPAAQTKSAAQSRTKGSTSSRRGANKTSRRPRTSSALAPILPFDSDEEDNAKPMTYDEKRQLSLDINKLPGHCYISRPPLVTDSFGVSFFITVCTNY